MALMRKPQHRRFSYDPRYYKPELDKDQLRRKRMKFHRSRALRKRAKPVLYWIVLFLFLTYIYAVLAGWFD